AQSGAGLARGCAQVLGRELPEALVAQGPAHVPEVDAPDRAQLPLVLLTTQRQERVRPQHERAVDAAREVDAQERVRGIRDGVDEALDDLGGSAPRDEVVAVEGDDPRLLLESARHGEPIRLETRTGDGEVVAARVLGDLRALRTGQREHDPDLRGQRVEPSDLRAVMDPTAGRLEVTP